MFERNEAIPTDAPDTSSQAGGALSIDEATDAFMNRWQDRDSVSEPEGEEAATQDDTSETSVDPDANDPDHPSDEPEAEETEEEAEDPEEETSDEDGEEETQEDEEEAPKVATDDALVTVTVDGQEHQVSVSQLKRLYGQEAALTRKSQEVARVRKEAEEQAQRYTTGLASMAERAAERYKKYQDIDMLVASRTMPANEFAKLRSDAKQAYEDFKFFTEELDQHMTKATQEHQKRLQGAAQEALKTIKDETSPHHIPNWSNQLYDDLRTYAVEQGLPAQAVNTLVDPAALKLIYKAMQADKVKPAVTKKIAKVAPRKVVKSKAKTSSSSASAAQATKALQQLQNTGSIDDATEAFLARWSSQN